MSIKEWWCKRYVRRAIRFAKRILRKLNIKTYSIAIDRFNDIVITVIDNSELTAIYSYAFLKKYDIEHNCDYIVINMNDKAYTIIEFRIK